LADQRIRRVAEQAVRGRIGPDNLPVLDDHQGDEIAVEGGSGLASRGDGHRCTSICVPDDQKHEDIPNEHGLLGER
jgi:hypothetical protein